MLFGAAFQGSSNFMLLLFLVLGGEGAKGGHMLRPRECCYLLMLLGFGGGGFLNYDFFFCFLFFLLWMYCGRRLQKNNTGSNSRDGIRERKFLFFGGGASGPRRQTGADLRAIFPERYYSPTNARVGRRGGDS